MLKKYYIKLKNYISLGIIKKSLVANVIISYILFSLSSLMIPYFAASIVDNAMLQDYTKSIIIAIILLVTACIYLLCSHYRYVSYTKNNIYIHNKLQQIILKKITTYDDFYMDTLSNSSIINTAYEDLNCVMEVMDQTLNMASACLSIIGSIIILLTVNIYVGLIALVLYLISMYRLISNMLKRDHYLNNRKKHQDNISNLLNQVLDGNVEINAFNMNDTLNNYLNDYKRYWKNDYNLETKYDNRVYVTVPTILGVGKIFIYLILVYLIFGNMAEVATLILVIGYYKNIQTQFTSLYSQLNLLTKNLNSVDRIKDILTYQCKDTQEFGDYYKDNIEGIITLDKVTYKMDNKLILKNSSYTFNSNTLTGITGVTNSGKTTLFKLILRLNRLTEGTISLDDRNIYDYDSEMISNNIVLVNENPFIFDMSIKENLSLIDSNTKHQIEVCKSVGVHDNIMSLSDGYKTKIVRDGDNISPEIKILLAIARALLSNAKIILIDDIFKHTSNIEFNKIKKILNELKKEHTIIIITNDEKIMNICDDVLEIKNHRLKSLF